MSGFEGMRLAGAGGGKGGSGSSGGVEAPNTLRSNAVVRVIDVLSEGPIQGLVAQTYPGQSIYFNDTPLQDSTGKMNFEGVSYALRYGTPTQQPVSGYPAVETVTAIGTAVTVLNGPVVQSINNTADTSVLFTITVNALYAMDTKNGNMNDNSFGVKIEVQPNGTSSWTTVVTDTVSGKCVAPYQRTYKVSIPTGTAFPINLRMSRTTPDDPNSASVSAFNWTTITEEIEHQLIYPDTAYIALTVDATAFGGAIPTRSYDVQGIQIKVPANYNPVTRTYATTGIGTSAGSWDGVTFQLAWSNNPAWILYDLLTNNRYGLGDVISTSYVDVWSLYVIGQYCDGLVDNGAGGTEPRYTFNGVINTIDDAYKVVQSIASSFAGMTYWGAGQIMVVQDAPANDQKLFTEANVIDGRFSYQGTALNARHSMCAVQWLDPGNAYRPTVDVVSDPAMIQLLGVRRKDVTGLGITSRGQAIRFARWVLDSEKHATETVTFKAGIRDCDVRPGMVVAVQDAHYAGLRNGGLTTTPPAANAIPRSNLIANGDATGAVGPSNTMPTDWALTSTGGATVQVIGTGIQDSGMGFVDLKVSGAVGGFPWSFYEDLVSATSLSPVWTFTRSSTATYLGADGLLHSAAANVPRFDYTVAGGPLLIEGQSTNLMPTGLNPNLIYHDTNWNAPTVSTAIPGLLSTASVILHSLNGAGANNAGEPPGIPVTSGTQYTLSMWIWLPVGHPFTNINIRNVGFSSLTQLQSINLSLTGQWQRITTTGVASGASANILIQGTTTASSGYFYSTCWQFEAGDVATSFIPTSGSSATRTTEALSISASSLGISAASGLTAVLEAQSGVQIHGKTGGAVTFSGGSGSVAVSIDAASGGPGYATATGSANVSASLGTPIRAAAAFNSSGANGALSVNGSTVIAGTSTGATGAYTTCGIVAGNMPTWIRKLVVYPTARSNSDLAMLSGLSFNLLSEMPGVGLDGNYGLPSQDILIDAAALQALGVSGSAFYVGSAYLKLMYGSYAGLTALEVHAQTSHLYGTSTIVDADVASPDMRGQTLTAYARGQAALTSGVASTLGNTRIRMAATAGMALSFVLRVGAVQFESGTVASSYLSTSGTPTTVYGPSPSVIALDGPVTLTAGFSYTLLITDATGQVQSGTVANGAGTYSVLTLTSALPSAPPPGSVWILTSTQVAPRPFRVLAVAETRKNVYEVTGLQYDPGKYNRVDFNIQTPDANYSDLLPAPSATIPAPLQVIAQEYVSGVGTTSLDIVTVSWSITPDARITGYELQVLASDGSTILQDMYPNGLTIDLTSLALASYFFRVRALTVSNAFSAWTTSALFAVTGQTTAPNGTSAMTCSPIFNGNALTWANPSDRLLKWIEIWRSTDNVLAHASIIQTVTAAAYTDTGLNNLVTYYYWTRVVDTTSASSYFTGPVSGRPLQIQALDMAANILTIQNFVAGLTAVGVWTGASLPANPAAANNATVIVWQNDFQLYRWNSTSMTWTTFVNTTSLVGTIPGSTVSGVISGATLPGSAITGSLTTATIPAASITGTLSAAQIASLAASQITGTLTSSQIASVTAASITGTIAANQVASIPSTQISGTLTSAQIASVAASTVTGTLTSAQIASVAATTITGSIAAAQIGSVNASAITGTLTSAHIASVAASTVTGTLTSSQIASITAAQITGTIAATQVASIPTTQLTGTITSAQIASVAASLVTGTLTSSQIASVTAASITGTIAATQIASIPSTQISGTLTAAQIASLAASQITGTLTASQIASLATSQLTGTITASQITANSITAGQIAAGTITATQIAAGTITASQIAAGTILAANIAAGAITAASLSVGSPNNQIWNSCATLTDAGWSYGIVSGGGGFTHGPVAGSSYAANWLLPGGSGYAFMATAGSYFSAAWTPSSPYGVPVTPGQWYAAQALIAVQNTGADVIIQWYTSAGAAVSSNYGTGVSAGATSGLLLSNYAMSYVVAQAPATAAYGLFVIQAGNGGMSNNALMVWTQALFGQVSGSAVTGPVAWTPGGVTQISGGQIISQSITASQILANTITASQIAAATITSAQIAASTITAAQILSGTITASQIATGTIVSGNIAASTITGGNIAGLTITASNLVANTITAAQILAGTITTTQIASATIVAGNIAAGTITATQILAGTITTSQIAANTILAGNIAAATITGAKIAATTIAAGNIVSNTITALQILSGTITTTQIAASTIVAGNIAAGTITASQIAAGTITASQIATGTIQASNIASGQITTALLAVGGTTNVITNSCFTLTTAGWLLVTGGGGAATSTIAPVTASSAYFMGQGAGQITATSIPNGGWVDYVWAPNGANATLYYPQVPVIAGNTYQWQFKAISDTANITCDAYLVWYSATGTNLGSPVGFTTLSTSSSPGTLANWTSMGVIATAPVGAVSVALLIRNGNNTGATATYNVWITQTLFGQTVPNATQLSPWSPGGVTQINGGQIVAQSITAAQILANTITASQIAANTITAAQIAATTITAAQIAAGTITTSQIATGTIQASNIAANTITAAQIAANSIGTAQLNVGFGTNVISNPSCQVSGFGWFLSSNAAGPSFGQSNAPGFFSPAEGGGTLYATSISTSQFLEAVWSPVSGSNGIAVIPGTTLEAQAKLGANRCCACVQINFFDASGTLMSYVRGTRVVAQPGNTLGSYVLSSLIAVVPASAATAEFIIHGYNDGGSDFTGVGSGAFAAGNSCYVWFCQASLGLTVAGATQVMPYTPGGVTSINGGMIATNSIAANTIIAGSLTATQIAVGSITADRFTAGALSASNITSGTLTSGVIIGSLASFGTVQIGSAQIQNLNVTRITIANGAVGVSGSSSGTSPSVTVSFDNVNSTAHITGQAFFIVNSLTNCYANITFNLTRDGTAIFSQTVTFGGVNANYTYIAPFACIDTPSSGSHTYAFTWSNPSNSGTVYVCTLSTCLLQALVTQK